MVWPQIGTGQLLPATGSTEGTWAKKNALNETCDRAKTFFCSHCRYSSTRLDNYKRHMRRHTGQLFQCEICHVQFNCRYYLQKHKLNKHGMLGSKVC